MIPSSGKYIRKQDAFYVVLSQNKNFRDRPVIRILKDKNGNDVKGEVIKDLVKIHNIFIERTID